MHKDDKQWVQSMIAILPPELRITAKGQYDKIYNETHNMESVAYRKDNTARREANTRLRVAVNKYNS